MTSKSFASILLPMFKKYQSQMSAGPRNLKFVDSARNYYNEYHYN